MSIRLHLAAAAAVLAASPGLAATLASSSGTVALFFADVPEGVFVFRAEDANDVQTIAPSFSTTVEVSTEAQAEESSVEDQALFDSSCTVSTCSAPSGPEGFESVFVRNFDGPNPEAVATGPITLSGVLDYDLSSLGRVDDPASDSAFALATLEFFIDGDPFGDPFFAASARSDAPGEGNPSTGVESGSLPFDVVLDPQGAGILDTVELQLRIKSVSLAEDVSPIPLPAGLPLLAAGLGGLALLRR